MRVAKRVFARRSEIYEGEIVSDDIWNYFGENRHVENNCDVMVTVAYLSTATEYLQGRIRR